MANDFLEKVVAYKKSLIAGKQAFYQNLKKNVGSVTRNRYQLFKKAISKPGDIHLIAEIKKASPSQGIIREDFDVHRIAKIYTEYKAAALSVLTEDKFFLGKMSYLRYVNDCFSLPTLMKDFIIHECQIYEGSANGASAVLLIMAILNDQELQHLREVATALDLDCLVEVHDAVELKRALALGVDMIGINNRNLHTLEVNLKTCEQLIPLIPKDKVIVAESGIKTHADVMYLKNLGAHAVLIGETFMRSSDIGAKIKEVMHGQS